MSTPIDWPTGLAPARCEMGLRKLASQHRSELSGTLQAVITGPELWEMTVTFDARNFSGSEVLEVFLNTMTGGEQEVRAWHFARATPRGTMRGAPTLAAPAAQYATQFTLAGALAAGGAPGTLKRGDMIKIGGTLLQVRDDAAANASGQMTVTTVNRLRRSAVAGEGVLWDRCTARFVLPDLLAKANHSRGVMQGTSITLMESP